MQELLEQIRAELDALNIAPGKRARRYPESMREMAMAYSSAARKRGDRVGVIARDLGIDRMTLAAWEKKAASQAPKASPEPRNAFEQVMVVADAPPATSTVCVVGPKGLRIEGLTIGQVASLIERLAC